MEAELIRADDVLSELLWSRYFIELQGFEVDEAVIYQDNLSSILLENNGRLSSVNRKKHIPVIYLLIKDIISMGNLYSIVCMLPVRSRTSMILS